MRGSTGGGARIPPSLAIRPPSALLLPSGGVSEPVLAVEMVAWLSTVLLCPPQYRSRRASCKCIRNARLRIQR